MTSQRPWRNPIGKPVQAAFVLLAVALAGVLGGIALDRFALLPRMFPAHGWQSGFGAPSPHAFRNRIARELDLSPDQRIRMDSILDRFTRELCAVRQQVQPRLDSIHSRGGREMETVLTPPQWEKAKAFIKKHHRPGGSPHGPAGACSEERGRK